MATKKDIYDFAARYLQLFTQPGPPGEALLTMFGKESSALGFQRDLGESFMRMFSGDAFYDADEFEKIASQIEDPYVLGTALYSRWRLVTQWERNNLLADDKRAWFQAALKRLAELTAETSLEESALKGDIDSILIVSNNLEGVPGSAMATGMEQRLSITASGDVSLASTKYNAVAGGHNVISRQPSVRIDRASVRQIMESVRVAFPYLPPGQSTASGLSASPGTWNLIVTNQWGRPYRMSGEMGSRIIIDDEDLSDLIREKTNNPDLLLFDGNPDLIMQLDIQYRRGVPVPPADDNPDTVPVQWVYGERLVFDRTTQSMEHSLDAGPNHRVRTSAQLGAAVADFLDTLDPEHGFSEPIGNPPDAVPYAGEVVWYQIAMLTKHGTTRAINGTYDARSLPREWASFIDQTLAFMGFFEYGELFDEARYGRALRRTSDYIYVLAAVDEDSEPEWLLSDDPKVKDDDIVVVPYGDSGEERTARVLQVVYGSDDEAPDDFSSMRRVVRSAGQAAQP